MKFYREQLRKALNGAKGFGFLFFFLEKSIFHKNFFQKIESE